MREAVQYYETSEFRNSVKAGFNTIAAKLDRLAYAIQNLRGDICEMNSHIIALTQNAEQVSSGINGSLAVQRDILAESKATRYATESLQQAVERYNRIRT